MQQPKKVKYRKSHRGKFRGEVHKGNTLEFGDYGLQALESIWLTARQIEAARRAMTHHIRRGGNVWIRVFPDVPVTKKAAETRQGGGKGPVDHWIAIVRRGRMLFEMGGVDEVAAKEALRLAAHKLPLKTKFVVREAAAATTEAKELAKVEA